MITIILYTLIIIGSVIAILGGLLLFLLICYYMLRGIISLWGNISFNAWILVEYAYHRKAFKEWIKDKERHPKMKKESE